MLFKKRWVTERFWEGAVFVKIVKHYYSRQIAFTNFPTPSWSWSWLTRVHAYAHNFLRVTWLNPTAQARIDILFLDSPGAPPSATAHELFRGFSYIAPMMLNENPSVVKQFMDNKSISNVSKSTCSMYWITKVFLM